MQYIMQMGTVLHCTNEITRMAYAQCVPAPYLSSHRPGWVLDQALLSSEMSWTYRCYLSEVPGSQN